MTPLLIYLAGLLLIAGVAWAVASPWWSIAAAGGVEPHPGGEERWRRQKEEALGAIKDAEFDFHLGKLSEADYLALRARLETEALEAMEKESDGHA